MNENTYKAIEDIALYIEKFRELDKDDQSWIRELLKNGKTVLSCLEILNIIENESMNYYEIASILGCNWQTAKQKLNALTSGGIAIKEERDGRFVCPVKGGRPRKLTRKVLH